MIPPEDVRAIIDLETYRPSRHEQARALRLCIEHLRRDAEDLGLAATCRNLDAAAASIEREVCSSV